MSVRIIHPGAWATVQDLGRAGCAAMGVSAGGAADTLSLRVGNRLVGNDDGAPAVEMTLVGGRFTLERDALVAFTGATCAITLEQRGGRLVELAPWRAFTVRAGETVRLGALRTGARVYLCVAGGIDTPPALGSRSMHVQSGLGTPGGACGRTLRAGDVLPVGEAVVPTGGLPGLSPDAVALMIATISRRELRVTPGAHAAALGVAYLKTWFEPWRVSSRFDRAGLRLERVPGATGTMREAPPMPGAGSITTEAAAFGGVQITPSGEPILLGPDAPPTGGYPVAGTVCAADLPSVGQLRAGDVIQFELVSAGMARALWHARRESVDATIPPAARTIDLNGDVGEFEDEEGKARDAALVREITSVSIACGGHAGSDATMRALLRAAHDAGTRVGAHPGYPDRVNFGRTPLDMPLDALEASVREQVAHLAHLGAPLGVRIAHVKPHGALYHAAGASEGVARAIARACRAAAPGAALIAQAGLRAAAWYMAEGCAVINEAFADRAYEADGTLAARGTPGALIADAESAAAQAVMVARDGVVRPRTGGRARVRAGTLCVHSDTPGALDIARAVRSALNRAGVRVQAPVITSES